VTEPRSRSTLVGFDRFRITGTLVINFLLLQILLDVAKVLFNVSGTVKGEDI